MTVDFKKDADKLFTQVIYKVQAARTRYVLVYGGASSSKSYSVHQLELINIMGAGTGDTLFVRKANVNLRDSCFKLLKSLIVQYGLSDLFTIYEGTIKIVYKPTGRAILFKGIDDPENLKSIVGIKRIIIEEATQLELPDFMELNRRARGIEGIQMILICNPISENHWIKTHLVDGKAYKERLTVLLFTYKDNCNLEGKSFLTEDDIAVLEAIAEVDENQYNIYVLGQWGVENKDGKYVWAFNREQIKATKIDKTRVVWATFDFNINPMTCTVAQVFPERRTIRAIECIKLQYSDVWAMCERLISTYQGVMWMVTGDATGQGSNALAKDNISYYQAIIKSMRIGDAQIQVPTVNPRVADNRLVVNAVHKNWIVEIDPTLCEPLIYDLTYVEINQRNEIIKDRSSDKKYADFLDNWRYLINIAVKPHLNYDFDLISQK